MKNSLAPLAWIVFFIVYGSIAAAAWSWLARRHVASVRSAQQPSFSQDAPVILIALAVGVLPAAVFLVAGYGSAQNLSFGSIVIFCSSWAVAALPGIFQARRIMRTAGIDPDAA